MRNIKLLFKIVITLNIFTGIRDVQGKYPDKYPPEKEISTTSTTDHKDSTSIFDKSPSSSSTSNKSDIIDIPTEKKDSESIEKDPINPFVSYPKPTPKESNYKPQIESTIPISNSYSKNSKSIKHYLKTAKDLIKKSITEEKTIKLSLTAEFHQCKKDQLTHLLKIERSTNDVEAANKKANEKINAAVKKLQKSINDSFKRMDNSIKRAPEEIKIAIKQLKNSMYEKIDALQNITGMPKENLQTSEL